MKDVVRIIEEKQENNLREWKWEKEAKWDKNYNGRQRKSNSSIAGVLTHIYTQKMKQITFKTMIQVFQNKF